MRYLSTRDPKRCPQKFSDILLEGLAPDGGLFLPTEYPTLTGDDLDRFRTVLRDGGYAALAGEVLQLFIDDIPAEDLVAICTRAYSYPKFSEEEIVTVTHLEGDIYKGGLSYGPTAAFKDMAMQLLGELFEYELKRRNQVLNILGATSGDTGSSAEYAMRGREGISIFMLTPRGRMTAFQQAQMFSIDDPNVINMAVDGVFDDCQDIVKAVSSDLQFKRTWSIGAVNSINWARLVAQVVYYIYCWLRMTEGIAPADQHTYQISFAVPTGNFGDVCAGHVARSMGLPIDKLIVVTNENDVLNEFFSTGVYRVRSAAQTLATSSPSMDISKASNFERFIADLLGRDANRVADLFGRQLSTQGYFDLSDDPDFQRIEADYGFMSGSSTHQDRLDTIRETWENDGVMIDPHTADGVKVARELKAANRVNTPIVCLETALPVKFAETITEATGELPETPERFQGIEDLPRRVLDVPNDTDHVKGVIVDTLTQLGKASGDKS